MKVSEPRGVNASYVGVVLETGEGGMTTKAPTADPVEASAITS